MLCSGMLEAGLLYIAGRIKRWNDELLAAIRHVGDVVRRKMAFMLEDISAHGRPRAVITDGIG